MGPDGRMQGTALIVLDISARRRAQRMLERFVEHAPNVIAVKDLDGRYLLFSAHGASLVRRRPEDLIGLTDREIYGDAMADQLEAQDRQVIEEGTPLDVRELVGDQRRPQADVRHDQVPAPRPGREA